MRYGYGEYQLREEIKKFIKAKEDEIRLWTAIANYDEEEVIKKMPLRII